LNEENIKSFANSLKSIEEKIKLFKQKLIKV